MLIHNRYSVERELGKGGRSSVYQVYDHRLSMHFASKRILLENDQDKYAFQLETEILTKLHHPNIPRIIDSFIEHEYAYMIMDRIEGKPLIDFILQKMLVNEKMIIDWMLKIIDIFLYLHETIPDPLLFLDLKPQNIMITDTEQLYLIDYGSSSFQSNPHITSATPGYAPDELLHKHKASKCCDIYSFGITFYVLLHGHFPKESSKKTSLDKVLLACCSKDKQKIFHNFSEVQHAVLNLSIKRSLYRTRIIIFSILCLLSFLFANYQLYLSKRQNDKDYLSAMSNKDYLQAIKMKPSLLQPYQSYYESKCTTTSTCEKAFNKIEALVIQLGKEKETQIAFYLATELLSQHTKDSFQRAAYYLSNVSSSDKEEEIMISNIKVIIETLSKHKIEKEELQILSKSMHSVELYSNQLKNIKEKYMYVKLLVMLYDMNLTLLPESYDKIIELCSLMKHQLQSNPNIFNMKEQIYVEERLAYAFYYKGLSLYKIQDYEGMQKAYVDSISYFKKSKVNERFALTASMLLYNFDYGYQEEEKKGHIDDLNEINKIAENIEIEETRIYMLEMIERRVKEYGS